MKKYLALLFFSFFGIQLQLLAQPLISHSPGLFNTTINSCDDSVVFTLTIYNTGSDTLDFDILDGENGAFAELGFAYHADRDGNTLEKVDLNTNTLVGAPIPVGLFAWRVEITPNGKYVYVSNRDDTTVSVVEIATDTVVATIPVGLGPAGLAFTPDGQTAYVCNRYGNSVSKINTATNTVVSTLSVGFFDPQDIVISPDGAFAYVASSDESNGGISGRVSVIDLSTDLIVDNIFAPYAHSIVITPDGQFVYVTRAQNETEVTVIETATNTILTQITGFDGSHGLDILPDGSAVYIIDQGYNSGTSQVKVIDVATNTVTATITDPGFQFCWGIATSPRSDFVYMTNPYGTPEYIIIDVATNSISTSFNPVGGNGRDVATLKGNALWIGQDITSGNVLVGDSIEITVTLYSAGLENGVYNANVYIASNDSTSLMDTIPVTLTVNGVALLDVTVPCLDLDTVGVSGTNNATFSIINNGCDTLFVTGISTGTGEFSTDVSSQIVLPYDSEEITASFSPLSTGAFVDSIYIVSSDIDTVICLTGFATPAPTIGFSPDTINVTFNVCDDSTGVNFTVYNTGSVNLNYSHIESTLGPFLDYAYTANVSDGSVSVIDMNTNTIVGGPIGVGNSPSRISVRPGGEFVYVSNGQWGGSNEVSVIRISDNTVVATIPVGSAPHGLEFTPSGDFAYVANRNDNNVMKIDCNTNTVVGTIIVGGEPQDVEIGPDGSFAYVVTKSSGVFVIDLSTDLVATTIVGVGSGHSCALTPNGEFLYVTHSNGGTGVSVISTASNSVVTVIGGNDNPHGIAASPDGQFMYVADYNSGQIDVIDVNTNAVLTSVSDPLLQGGWPGPWGITISPDGNFAYVGVSWSDPGVVVVDLNTYSIVTSLSIPGGDVMGIATMEGGLPWLVATPTGGGTIVPGDSVVMTASISGTNLNSGVYQGNVVFSSNDPGSPTSFPIILTINGAPELNLSANCANLDTAMIGGSNTQKLWVSNTGCDSLFISGSTVTLPIYSVQVASSIAPKDSVLLTVTFSPTALGTFLDTIQLTTNDKDTSICLVGVGVPAPTIGTDSTSFNVTLTSCDDTALVPLTIYNTGAADLNVGVYANTNSPQFPYAYITNYGDNTVSVFDVTNNSLLPNPIGVGTSAWRASLRPDNRYAYITNRNSANISVIQTSNNALAFTIPVGGRPMGIGFTPDSRYGYVVSRDNNDVRKIDFITHTVISTLTHPSLDNPQDAAITADGKYMYVANRNTGMTIFEVGPDTVITTIPTSNLVEHTITMSPDGAFAYVSRSSTDDIIVISTATHSLVQTIPGFNNAHEFDFTEDEAFMYVANRRSDNVLVMDVATNTIVATIWGINDPWGLKIVGDYCYVSARNGGTVDLIVIDIATNTIISTVDLPGNNHFGIAASKNGMPWLSAIPNTGATVAPGDSAIINIELNGYGLNVGTYTGEILLPSNDPANPIDTVLYTFTIQGAPEIAPSVACANLDTIIEFNTTQSNYMIYNTGCDTLIITDQNITLSAYSLSDTTYIIPPRDSALVTVTFSPLAAGTYLDTINIFNNDVDTTICLAGVALLSPTIATSTDSINVLHVVCDDTSSVNLTVYNTGAGDLDYTISTPTYSPLLTQGYVCDYGNASVSVIDLLTNTIVGSPITVGANPWRISIRPGNQHVYVSNRSSATVSVIQTSDNTVIATIPVGSTPTGMGITPDGNFGYVGNRGAASVSKIDLNTNTVVSTLTASISEPHDIIITPDGQYMYIANRQIGITIYEVGPDTVVATIPSPNLREHSLAMSPDGQFIYVSRSPTDDLLVISTATNSVATTISGFNQPHEMAFTADGTSLYVANRRNNNVLVVDVATNTIVNTIFGINQAWGMAIYGDYAYATVRSGTPGVQIIDLATNTIVGNMSPAGTNHFGIAVSSTGGPWLTANPNTGGTILPGDSTIINIAFNGVGLSAGTYTGDVLFDSNDPLNPLDSVAVNFEIQGSPSIDLSAACLTMDTIMEFNSTTDTFTIYNTGCDTLFITDGNNVLPEYTASDTSGYILPWDSTEIVITFLPVDSGLYLDTITLFNNDVDTTLCLAGYVLQSPTVAFIPDSLNVTIASCCDSVADSIMIYNNGAADLIFSIAGSGGGGLPDILLVSADNLAYEQDVQTKLLGTGLFNSVTLFDAAVSTPTLGTLQLYDAVLVWRNNGFNNTTILGDNLADYVDGGGGVVTAVFANVSSIIAGRWNSDNYWSLIPTGNVTGAASLGTVFLPSHPIMENVVSFNGGTSAWRTSNFAINGSATRVADWSDGRPLIATREINGSFVVDLGMFPPSTDAIGGGWVASTDGALIMANSLAWSIDGGSASWLSLTPLADTVTPGDSVQIDLMFNSCGLAEDIYMANLVISSNDPQNPMDTVSLTFTVDGAPDIDIAPNSCLSLDTAMEFTSNVDSFLIRNIGCDTLFITDANNLLPEFTLSDTAGLLLPGDSGYIVVTFSPLDSGIYLDTIIIYNNDVDTALCLVGIGLKSPTISESTDSVEANFFGCCDSLTVPVTIYNSGAADLIYSSSISGYDSTQTVIFTSSGAITNFTFDNLPPTDSVLVTVTLNGDYDGGGEMCELYVDGDYLGIINDGNPPNGTNIIVPYWFTGAQLATWLLDGQLVVTLDNDGSVGTFVGTEIHQVQVFIPTPSWVITSSLPDTVAPGDSSTLNVILTSCGSSTGSYVDYLYVTSNDPQNAVDTIVVSMTLVGAPDIDINTPIGCLDFDTIMEFTTAIDSFEITNSGCDTLWITDVNNVLPEFTLSDTAGALLPGESGWITVTFAPLSSGSFLDTFNIFNNDVDTFVCLVAEALQSPTISFSPDSIDVIIASCCDSTTVPVTVYNTGGADLIVNSPVQQFGSVITYSESFIGGSTYCPGNSQYDNWGLYRAQLDTNLYSFTSVTIRGSNDMVGRTCTDLAVVQQMAGSLRNGVVGAWVGCDGNNWNVGTGCMAAGCPLAADAVEFNANGSACGCGPGYMIRPCIGNSNWGGINSTNCGAGTQTMIVEFTYNGWMEITPTVSDTIAPGDSSIFNVQVSSCGQSTGNYSDVIVFSSNDPLNPSDSIQIAFEVIGQPDIDISDTCLYLDSIMEYTSFQNSVWIENTGCDTLFVTDANNVLPEYTLSDTVFAILPGDSTLLTVTFSPITSGPFLDTITLLNNAGDTTICLSGYGWPRPVIAVDTDSINILIAGCCDSTTVPVTIYNTGGNDLIWSIDTSDFVSRYDGVNDYIAVPTDYPGLSVVTVEAWIKPTNLTGYHWIAGNARDCCGNAGGFNLYLNGNGLEANVWRQVSATTIGISTPGIISLNTWQHVAMVYTGTQVDIYLNGALVGSSTPQGSSAILNAPQDFVIGVLAFSAPSFYDYVGDMDEVRVWNTARSTGEISGNMNTKLLGSESGLLGYWNFDGQNADDLTSAGNNGVFMNQATTVQGSPFGTPVYNVSMEMDTVAVGDSSVVDIIFTTCGKTVGTYTSLLNIVSNDPLNSPYTIPTTFEVQGSPEIELSDTCIYLDSIIEFTTFLDSFYIRNVGCDTLFVTDANNVLPAYTLSDTAFVLLPGDSAAITVTFSPVTPGTFLDTITIINNDKDSTICLTGYAIPMPTIAVDTDSVTVVSGNCCDTTLASVTVYNTGGSDLIFDAISNQDFYEDFEGGLGSWVTTGSWSISTDPYEGSNSLAENASGIYGNGMSQTITTQDNFAVRDAANCVLTYMHKRGMECCCDAFRTQISVNNGAYITLSSVNCNDATYSLYTFPLSGFVVDGDSVRVRFQFTSDGSITGTGVEIDSLRLVGITQLPDWLTVNPTIDTVPAGDSSVVALEFISCGLITGVYTDSLTITSNDPLNPSQTVHLSFTLNGYPEIDLSDSCLVFDTILQFTSTTLPLTVYNTGCDTLFVTNMVSSSADITVDTTNFTIMPSDSLVVTATFSPLSVGAYAETLIISNNDADSTICLTGFALSPPIITYAPDTFFLTSTVCNDTLLDTLTIYNLGVSDLTYTLGSVSSVSGYSAQFDAASEYIQIPTLALTASYTLEAWSQFPLAVTGSWRTLYQTGGNQHHIIVDVNGMLGVYNFGFSSCGFDVDGLTPGWHFISAVASGAQTEFFIDGVSVGISATNLASGLNYLGNYSGGGQYWGNADEFRVWNYARSTTETQNSMYTRLQGNEAGLLGYWNFDDQTTDDISSGGSNGTLTNGASLIPVNAPVGYTSFSLMADTVLFGDSSLVGIEFSTNGLITGTYYDTIIISSNDPLSPSDTVTVLVDVIGYPVVASSDTCLNFDSILQFTSTARQFQLYNTGCDTLFVDSIAATLSAYSIDSGSFLIAPGDSILLTATFAPTALGAHPDTFNVYSNDSTLAICLIGVAVPPPTISTLPDTINLTITACTDSVSTPLTVYNTGGSSLYWTIDTGGYYASFDGAGDYISMNNASVRGLATMTMEMWVQPKAGVINMLLDNGASVSDPSFENSGGMNPLFYVANSGGADFGALGGGTWSHLAATIDGSRMKTYLNGVMISDIPFTLSTSATVGTLFIASRTGGSFFFNGWIDEIRVWNVARSQAEIQANMANSLVGTETGLTGYWNFNDGTANDLSIGGNNGTLFGNAALVPDTNVGNLFNLDMIIDTVFLSDSSVIDVRFDATSLTPGTYMDSIIISSNDPLTPELIIPTILTISPFPIAPVAGDSTICFGDINPTFTATGDTGSNGDTIYWFSDAALTLGVDTGNTFTPADIAIGSYVYYLTYVEDSCSSPYDSIIFTINTGASAPVAADTGSCFGDTVPDLTSSPGNLILWYDDGALTNQVSTGQVFATGDSAAAVYTYYLVDSVAGCPASPSDTVTLTITGLPPAPIAGDTTICEGDSVPNLIAVGANIVWYDNPLPSAPISTNDSLATGETTGGVYVYYVTQDSIGCPSLPDTVTLTINSTTPPTTSDAAICFNAVGAPLVAVGDSINWYADSALAVFEFQGDSFLAADVAVGSYTYWATQTDTVTGCESIGDSAVYTINPIPGIPVTSDTSECFGQPMPDLAAVGVNILWYLNPALDTVVGIGSPFATGDTAVGTHDYYVTQTVLGCEGPEDTATLTILPIPVAPLTVDSTICFGTATPDFIAVGANIHWYSDAGLTTEVFFGDTFASGQTTVGTHIYYATDSVASCEGPASMMTVTIIAPPVTPVVSDETICFGTPTPDLIYVGNNTQWYDDAALTNLVMSGDTFLTGETAVAVYTYYVTDSTTACAESASDTVVLTINVIPSAPLLSDTAVCDGDSIPSLIAIGTGLDWYADTLLAPVIFSGDTFAAPDTLPGVYDYYVTQTIAGCLGPADTVILSINSTPAPTGANMGICFGDPVPDFVAVGANLSWYSDSALTTLVFTGDTFASGDTTVGMHTYFVRDSINGCPGPSIALTLTINLGITVPPVASDVNACYGASPNDLTAIGTFMTWYSDTGLTTVVYSGDSFAAPDTAVGSYTYYVTDSVAGCPEGLPDTSTLTILALPAAPVAADGAACFGIGGGQLIATGTGTIQWYSDVALTNMVSMGDTLAPTDSAIGSYTYYATDSVGLCESNPDTAIFTVLPIPGTPSTTDQTVCVGAPAPDFVSSGANIQWYADSALTTLLAAGDTFVPADTLVGIHTYYLIDSAAGCNSLIVPFDFTIDGASQIAISDICFDFDSVIETVTSSDTLEFYNAGCDTLIITGITNTTAEYTVDTTGLAILPGDTGIIIVSFTPPDSGLYVDMLVITSNASDTTVCLTGVGLGAPVISNSPDSFNLSYTGCCDSTTLPMTIYNTGESNLIYSIGSDSAWISFSYSNDTIAPGDSNIVGITFDGCTINPGNYTANIYLNSNDPASSLDTSFVVLTKDTLPGLPVAADIAVCFGNTIGYFTATSPDDSIVWYSDSLLTVRLFEGDTFYPPDTTIVGVFNYYATAWRDSCEGNAAVVQLDISPPPSTPSVADTNECFGYAIPALVHAGTIVQWYNDTAMTNVVFVGDSFISTDTSIGSYTYFLNDSTPGCPIGLPDTVVLTIDPTPLAPTGNDTTVCFGDPVPDLIAVGVNMAWYDDSTLLLPPVFNGDTFASGDTAVGIHKYWVTQTDTTVNSCESFPLEVTLTINGIPTAPAVTDSSICIGNPIPNFTTTGTNIVWYDDVALTNVIGTGDTLAAPDTVPGVFTYYVTDSVTACATGPVGSAVFTINAFSPKPTVMDTAVCFGSTNPVLVGIGVSLEWFSDSLMTSSVFIGDSFPVADTAVGLHSYYVTDSLTGCPPSVPDTSDFTIEAVPSAPVSSDITICFGDVTPDFIATGLDVFWYSDSLQDTLLFNGSPFTSGVTVVGAHDFYITQIDSIVNGCESPASMVTLTINPLPAAPTVLSGTVCEGGTNPDLIAIGTGINWYSDSTLLNNVGSNDTLVVTDIAAGTHDYYATQTVLGCEGAAAMATLTINPTPAAPIALSDSACEESATGIPKLTATGTNLTWYSDTGLTNVVGTGSTYNTGMTLPGTYTYYVTDSLPGCPGPATAVSLVISPIAAAPVGVDVTACSGTAIPNLTATGTGSDLRWFSDPTLLIQVGSGTSFATGETKTGTYTYYVAEFAPGCGAGGADTVRLTINPTPLVTISNYTMIILPGDSATVEAYNALTYTWSPATGLNTASGPIVTGSPTVTTLYTVTGTNAFGCSADTSVLFVVDDGTSIGDDLDFVQNVQIFPNPSLGEFEVIFTSTIQNPLEIRIINAVGEVIVREDAKLLNGSYHKVFNLVQMASGVYYIQIASTQGVVIKKLVILQDY